jgi:hypothetical protein
MRDIANNPYTPDEQRVSDYIQEITEGMIGSGDDPIGFLIASHRVLMLVARNVLTDGILDGLFAEATEAGSVPPTAAPEQRRP